MFITRRIGKILRGKANRTQVLLACVLGAMAGFTPSFTQSPALALGLCFLFLILNANLAVFLGAAAAAKALSLAVLPLSVEIGTWLLDGPPRELLRVLVNAPLLAWFGLDYYATSGGLVLGLGTGLIGGALLAASLTRFRRKLASLEEGSEKFRKYTSTWYVKLLLFVFVGGGKGKQKTWAQVLEEGGRGRPLRITGIVVVGLLCAGLYFGERRFGETLLTEPLRQGLERLNGATVDLEALGLEITGGTVRLLGLGLADSRRLERNSLAARRLEASLDTTSLLRRQFVIDRIVSREAAAWERRAEPGVRVTREQATPPPPPEELPPGARSLEDYLETAQTWKERFSQIQEILGMLAGSGESPEKTEEELAREQGRLELRRRRATGLRARAPSVLVRSIRLEDIAAESLGFERLDIEATNLSSHPHRVSEPARISIRSQDGTFLLEFAIAPQGQGQVGLELAYSGIPVSRVAGNLKSGGEPLIDKGTLDLEAEGRLVAEGGGRWRIDLPMKVTLRTCTLAIPGLPKTEVERLELPIGVRGSLTSPGIFFDPRALADALVRAGRAELADQVRKRADQLLGRTLPGVGDKLGGIIETAETPRQALEGAKKLAEEEARQKLEEEKQKALEAAQKKLEEEKRKALEHEAFETARKKAEEEARKAAEALKKLPGKLPGLKR